MATPRTRVTRSAPDKGSFPLDHERKCKVPECVCGSVVELHRCQDAMTMYMRCIREQQKGDTRPCEEFAKDYLTCRMEKCGTAPRVRSVWVVLGG